jgi:hypothetical protein
VLHETRRFFLFASRRTEEDAVLSAADADPRNAKKQALALEVS